MKEQQYPQVSVIIADNPGQLQDKINNELRLHPDVTSFTLSDGPGYRAIVQYEITESVPEDEGDRYYLETGKSYCCNDCPDCVWDPDRRAVTHWCQLHEDRVRLKAHACDEFYIRLRENKIHLVTAEERQARYEQMDQQQRERRKEEKQHASEMYKLKKREAKYAERLLKATTQLKEKDNGRGE